MKWQKRTALAGQGRSYERLDGKLFVGEVRQTKVKIGQSTSRNKSKTSSY